MLFDDVQMKSDCVKRFLQETLNSVGCRRFSDSLILVEIYRVIDSRSKHITAWVAAAAGATRPRCFAIYLGLCEGPISQDRDVETKTRHSVRG